MSSATAGTAPAYVLVAAPRPGRVSLAPLDADGGPAAAAWELALADLPAAVAELETSHPRWVWDDTQRWYPALLAAGVHVERCVDLRLSHAILRASTLTAASALATAPAGPWDGVAPAAVPTSLAAAAELRAPTGPTLFDDGLLDAPPPAEERPSGLEPAADARLPGAGFTARSAADARDPGPTRGVGARLAGAEPPGGSEGGMRARSAASDDAQPPAPTPPTPEAAEFTLQRAAAATASDPSRIALLLAAESAGALVAAELRHVGLPWSAARHDEILTELLGPRPAPGTRPACLEQLLTRIRTLLDDETVNPDSPAELLKALRRGGLQVSSTRSWELQSIEHPVIEPLLEYKKRSRLLTANGWNWLDSWVQNGRFHPNYLPGGVVTGRWAAEGGGALQLPKQIRGAVVADPGWVLVVADAAQLEPRILAALAGDRAMAAAGRGRDLYDGIVASGAVDTRAHAKVGMLGAMYGATTGESGRLLPRLNRAYPAAIAYVEAAARTGESGGVVTTRLGRTSPRPGDDWHDLRDEASSDAATDATRSRARTASRSWGRFTRNFVVQGTAAEWALCWIGSIRRRLWALDTAPDAPITARPHLAFFLHDEVMVHAPAHLADTVAAELRAAAAEAGRLIFGDAPVEFPVTVAIVDSYDLAK
ncbi:bifunctional 3'-5' exonuclease/DNA polymerase [Herbiconiux liangxiaofengii]|uniref:bifunctional 3'-5' exonuclease/DNA polymerase n=1 Tax=Herbiconiux liangxiaofengii TaxID=3342795 RepID=UPI0035B7DEF0